MISTVWIGIDHGSGFSSAPVIFETMIFPPGDEASQHGTGSEEYMERYSTEPAAQAGHDRALTWLRNKLGDDITADICGPLMPGSSDEKWNGDLTGEV